MDFIQIDVTKREETGKGPIGRLRRGGLVPGILYGLGRPNLQVSIPVGPLQRFFAAPSHLVELKMGDKARQAIVREVQIDPLTDVILHVDFHRVDADQEIEDHVRLTWKGGAAGISTGGMFQAFQEALHIQSKPGDLPSEFIVDISGMEVDDTITAGEIPLPSGVTLLSDPDQTLAQVSLPKLDTSSTADDEAAPTAPEVIGEKPAAEGEAE